MKQAHAIDIDLVLCPGVEQAAVLGSDFRNAGNVARWDLRAAQHSFERDTS
jgi:hypothetical protein